MRIKDIVTAIDAKIIVASPDQMDERINSACASDMMSDVLAFVSEQAILVTGLVNPQVVRTAEMMDMKCIIFARGKMPDKMTVELAQSKKIVLMVTKESMFTACGKLYAAGIIGEYGECKDG